MHAAIGYARVSTQEQGRSGFGLAAQRHEIEAFALREGFAVRSWHQDVQTGAGADALLLRPGLATTLTEAKSVRCPLLVSRLDRLSRNVHFITGLMEHKVHFMVAALGRDCDDFTLHIYASLAEQERKMMSERIKAAMAVRRSKGLKCGLELRSKVQRQRMAALARAALKKAALERAEAYRPHIEWSFRQPGIYGKGRPISFRGAAHRLNELRIHSPRGGLWWGDQVRQMSRRLGLHHPPGHLSGEEARARAHSIWKEHPEVTTNQLIAKMGAQYPLGTTRADRLIREFRTAAAQRSALPKQVGWPLDSRTAARIRVSALWRRHPDLTAKQVIERLGPGPFLNVKWVRQVMKDCCRVSVRAGSKAWLRGRRKYHSWRALDRHTS